jgi:hypothetical protein
LRRAAAKIDAHTTEWWTYTQVKAQQMAAEFDMKEWYFMDLFLQGGAHMIHHQESINPFNAFKMPKQRKFGQVCPELIVYADFE